MSYMLPHLHNGWQVDQAILSEEDRVVVSKATFAEQSRSAQSRIGPINTFGLFRLYVLGTIGTRRA